MNMFSMWTARKHFRQPIHGFGSTHLSLLLGALGLIRRWGMNPSRSECHAWELLHMLSAK